jgi:hypothetical protein
MNTTCGYLYDFDVNCTSCIEFLSKVSDLRQVGGFSQGTPVSSTNKTDCHDIIEKLLKVALNTIIHKPQNHRLAVKSNSQ